MIREATDADIPRIVELGTRSLVDGPYKDQPDNPAQSKRFAEQVLANPEGRILLSEDEGKVTGLLAFIIFPHYFTGERTATEIMWYVEPENRPGGAAMRLLWAAEEMAKHMGAIKMQFTAPTEAIGALYKRFGYSQIEVGYQKSLKEAQ